MLYRTLREWVVPKLSRASFVASQLRTHLRCGRIATRQAQQFLHVLLQALREGHDRMLTTTRGTVRPFIIDCRSVAVQAGTLLGRVAGLAHEKRLRSAQRNGCSWQAYWELRKVTMVAFAVRWSLDDLQPSAHRRAQRQPQECWRTWQASQEPAPKKSNSKAVADGQ